MKKLISFFLASIVAVSCMGTAVLAEESSVVESVIAEGNETYERVLNAPEETVRIEDEKGNVIRSPRNPYEIRILSRQLVNTEYKNKTGLLCAGQLPGGTSMPGGGTLYINEGGGSKIDVSFSLSWGPVSIGIAPGTKASVGRNVAIPANRYYYKAYTDKQYQFKRYRVTATWDGVTVTYYEVTKTLWSDRFYAVRV